MNTEEKESEEVTVTLPLSVLKQIDRIVNEKEISREQVIANILEDHFSNRDGWLDDLIH